MCNAVSGTIDIIDLVTSAVTVGAPATAGQNPYTLAINPAAEENGVLYVGERLSWLANATLPGALQDLCVVPSATCNTVLQQT